MGSNPGRCDRHHTNNPITPQICYVRNTDIKKTRHGHVGMFFSVAALFLLVGVSVASDRLQKNNDMPDYLTTVYVMSMLFAIVAGVSLLLDLLGIGNGTKTEPVQPTSA